MIFDAAKLKLPLHLTADLCIVGSGPGGGMVAMTAAEAGMKVVVLEAGSFFTPADMNQREEDMLPRLFWEAGGRATTDRAVYIHQGKGVGGSTLHNINLCKRIPVPILREWIQNRRLAHLELDTWQRLYQEIEDLLLVSKVSKIQQNRHNQLLEKACLKLGWQGGSLLHNRTGCVGSGFCELGCAYDAKNNVTKQLLPRTIKAGAEFFIHCQASRILFTQGQVTGLDAIAIDPHNGQPLGPVRVDARQVCLSASATGTAALLLRSKVPHPPHSIGNTLRIHPAVVVAGQFKEKINAWQGVPQSYECTEFLSFEHSSPNKPNRLWIIPAFAHPMGTSTMLPGYGHTHRQMMENYAHMAVLTAMLHDRSAGQVRPIGETGLRLDYWPNQADRQDLHFGLKACTRLLLAAGAQRVLIPTTPFVVITQESELPILDTLSLKPGNPQLTAVHPMGTVPMGDNPQQSAVDSRGRVHGLNGLWIADGSLFPTSIGVPPQISIYALGLHVGRHIVTAL